MLDLVVNRGKRNSAPIAVAAMLIHLDLLKESLIAALHQLLGVAPWLINVIFF